MFSPIPEDQLKKTIDAITDAHLLVAITLTSGDVLLGGLEQLWKRNGNSVELAFNTEQGQQFGDSWILSVPAASIADIQRIPLDSESLPMYKLDEVSLELIRTFDPDAAKVAPLSVKDYPNPWAAIICQHNLTLNARLCFERFNACEKALSSEHVPPEGIRFQDDYILYTDWDWFSRTSTGQTTIEVKVMFAGLSKDLGLPLNRDVVERLKGSWVSKLRNKTDPNVTKEITVHGQVRVPSPQEDTDIEGEKCIVIVCRIDDGDSKAVLVKKNLLKYPLEFLGFVKSVLSFYGEILPIPLSIAGKDYSTVILARAIGYVREAEDRHLSRRDPKW